LRLSLSFERNTAYVVDGGHFFALRIPNPLQNAILFSFREGATRTAEVSVRKSRDSSRSISFSQRRGHASSELVSISWYKCNLCDQIINRSDPFVSHRGTCPRTSDTEWCPCDRLGCF
jgi:hypothetical protein